MSNPPFWIDVFIACPPVSRDAVGSICFDAGCCGLVEEEDGIRAYFSETVDSDHLRMRLTDGLRVLKDEGLPSGPPQFQMCRNEDWGRNWRKYFKPVLVTSCIGVKPPWETWPGAPPEISVDIFPRMAFGTGTHETTQLCLQLLETVIRPGDRVLDVGTGSGVLAITAVKLGAVSALGVDIEEEAVENADENVRLNGVEDRVTIRPGSLEAAGSDPFDLVLANINLDVLARIIPELPTHLRPDGRLIVSGVLTQNHDCLASILADSGLRELTRCVKGEWLAVAVEVQSDQEL